MLTAEALAMAMKIPQHLHDVRRTVKLEFSALLADGTSRVNSESQSHGKIVGRISKRLRVGRRPPVNEYTHMHSQSPVLFPFRGSSAGCLSTHSDRLLYLVILPLFLPTPSPTVHYCITRFGFSKGNDSLNILTFNLSN